MTIKELIDILHEAGDEESEVRIRTRGTVNATVGLDGRYHGDFDLAVDVDSDTDEIEVAEDKNGLVVVTAWI